MKEGDEKQELQMTKQFSKEARKTKYTKKIIKKGAKAQTAIVADGSEIPSETDEKEATLVSNMT